MLVMWNGAYFSHFLLINGVRQCGILSPFLFSIFINDLILKLELNREGCFIGQIFYGCIAYADDILLLAPSLRALRCMLNICMVFASVNNIRFNSAKSHCIRFSRHPNCVKQFPVELQSVTLTRTDQILHLGHVLCSTLDDSSDTSARRRDFCSQAKYFFTRFNHIIPALTCHLFQTCCQSFYGSQIWDLQNATLNAFDVS